MAEQTTPLKLNNKYKEVEPGIWVSSARTPSEDSADWTPYTDEEFKKRMVEIKKSNLENVNEGS